ncbi:hypothetical protein ACS0TY_000356 [Phlomoides rotata]
MATTANEVLEVSSVPEDVVVEQNHENPASEMQNHGDPEPQPGFSEEEVRSTLETSAATGKFWQNWEKLKGILSYQLKQVLSEYPEAKMASELQVSSLGETFQELVKRLDDALQIFDEGPPFTLQRICEILLSARSIYPKLSKLCLALEKNLLVTSTLTMSCDTNTSPLETKQNSNGSYEGNGNALPQINSAENGVQAEDRDEVMIEAQEIEAQVMIEAQENEAQVMIEAQESEAGEGMPMDMETIEDVVRSSPPNPTPTVDS